MGYKKLLSVLAFMLSITGIAIVVVFFLYSMELRNQKNETDSQSTDREIAISENIAKLTDIAKVKKKEERQKREVSVQLSSIQKDIKVKLLDSNEKRIKGTLFRISVIDPYGQTSDYQDDDMDGYLHIENIKSGPYDVKLMEIEGLDVPKNPIRVRVKEEIQYRVLNDIVDEIKLESEINASLEDTANIEEVDQGVAHEVGKVGSLGIDVSKWNKEIDWQKVKDEGVEYAVIRLGYRGSSTGVLVEDPYFERNLEEASRVGINTAVYFFTQAINEVEAVEEASMCVALLDGKEIQMPIYLDVEGSSGRADSLDPTTRTNNILAFLKTIESKGYDAGVYANKNWLTNKIEANRLEKNEIWLAQYNVIEPNYEGNYQMWQYSSKGKMNGIEGYVDMNKRLNVE
ncbi:MAG: glycoside hydrolase family 25 protein [Lachnospiraceae bacterium]|nr:glycoside hydrolase family 25 protein [Lachnospiraceae bacterium]